MGFPETDFTRLIYRCPACGAFDWLAANRCRHCRASVALVDIDRLSINGRIGPIADGYDRVLGFPLPDGKDRPIVSEAGVRFSEEARQGSFQGLGGLRARRYGRRFRDRGVLSLFPKGLVFEGGRVTRCMAASAITGVTTESGTLILSCRGFLPAFFDFSRGRGKMFEDLVRRVIDRHHARIRIREYYPRLRGEDRPRRPAPVPDNRPLGRRVRWSRMLAQSSPGPGVRILTDLLRRILGAVFEVRIEGAHHVPIDGPAVVVSNHASFLDAIFLAVSFPRGIRFMTKNSQYDHPGLDRLLAAAGTFPVRRYAVDCQAVRNAVRVASHGHILGLFPEGERSWDGRMLPFRRGSLRLLLALGVPIVPVGICGAYRLMPRYTKRFRRGRVVLRVGPAFSLGPIAPAAQDEADIAAADQTLSERIRALIETPRVQAQDTEPSSRIRA